MSETTQSFFFLLLILPGSTTTFLLLNYYYEFLKKISPTVFLIHVMLQGTFCFLLLLHLLQTAMVWLKLINI